MHAAERRVAAHADPRAPPAEGDDDPARRVSPPERRRQRAAAALALLCLAGLETIRLAAERGGSSGAEEGGATEDELVTGRPPLHPALHVGARVRVAATAAELRRAVRAHPRLLWTAAYAQAAEGEGELAEVDTTDSTALVRLTGVSVWLPQSLLQPAASRRPRRAPRRLPAAPPRRAPPRTEAPRVRVRGQRAAGSAEGGEAAALAEAAAPPGTAQWPAPGGGLGGEAVRSKGELADCIKSPRGCWVTLRAPHSAAGAGRYVAAPAAEGAPRGAGDPRILVVTRDPAKRWRETPFLFRTRFATYLAAALDGQATVDRATPRSFEHWHVDFSAGLARLMMRCAPPICAATERRWLYPAEDAPAGLTAGKTMPPGFTGFEMAKVDSCSNQKPCQAPWRERPVGGEPSLPGFRMLLFTTLKPQRRWSDEDRSAVRNAIAVWRRLAPFCRVVVFSEDADTREVITSGGLTADGAVELNREFGVPTYRGMFRRAEELARPEERALAYANGDLLFTHSLAESVAATVQWARAAGLGGSRGFMLVGRRFNVDIKGADDLAADTPRWQEAVEALRDKAGREWQEDAIDYFVVSRRIWSWAPDGDVPAMVVGGTAFDNWVLQHAIDHSSRPIVADLTRTVTAVHQGSVDREGLLRSHAALQSDFNKRLGQSAGGWARGKVTMCPFLTVRVDGRVIVHRRGEVAAV
eukprot:TRINITY_DN26087_c0_g1_i1.p1 TRINITY_DN26087_c0_g1~~TRINITY_DN26087_c0_g1_i1.p1  ORF type:complete len:697 (+),score=157.43 TRINITY_DN26087_c0_g1_i1:127-2217(+)